MIENLREHLEKRINAATPTTSKFNYWPTGMELIDTTWFDLSNAEEAYRAGQLMGRDNYAYRQIEPNRIPIKIAEGHWYISTKFMLAPARGQMDDVETRNLLAVFEVAENPKAYPRKMHVVAIEVGCKHEYEVKRRGHHYDEGKCKKCGHHWYRDSSG